MTALNTPEYAASFEWLEGATILSVNEGERGLRLKLALRDSVQFGDGTVGSIVDVEIWQDQEGSGPGEIALMSVLDSPGIEEFISDEDIADARERLEPYIGGGHPEPMIDPRRLRISLGKGSERDLREIAAEDFVLKERGEQ